MNPKNTKKNSSKPIPKKKVKSNAKLNVQPDEMKSKFYIAKDEGGVNETQSMTEEKKIIAEEPKKLERSNSFLTRKLSKIYTKFSGSKENIIKTEESGKPLKQEVDSPPGFLQRSLTLNSIQLKKSYRKTFPELRLEKLSEEKISENDKLSHQSPQLSPQVILRSRSPTRYRQSMPAGAFDDIDFLKPPIPSVTALAVASPAPLERSGSFISLFRRKVSFNEPKPSPMTSNWAASLQSLQQIDNMVSYEDLSFVDYDKFNQYEQQVDKMLTRLKNKKSTRSTSVPSNNPIVIKRRPKRASNRMMGDFNSNLDREKNLYRQSIDSNKLRMLSTINLDSYRWNQADISSPIEWLSLDNTPNASNPIL